MTTQNLSWAILAFALGLVLSILGIIALVICNFPDPIAIGALATIASNCVVGLGATMNPNKKFSEVEKDLEKSVTDLKETLK